NETVKALTLFHREQIGHEGPENGGIKEGENTDPNKKTPADPYLLCLGTTSHCDEEECKNEDEKSVSKRKEFSPGHPRHSRGEGGVREQHHDQRRCEHPRQCFHVARANTVTDWFRDVIAGQD